MANKLTAKALREIFEANKAALTTMVLSQPKPPDKAKMVLAFEDSNGLKYYGYDPKEGLENLSIERYGHITRLLDELRHCVRGDEMDEFVDEFDNAVMKGKKKCQACGQHPIDGERIAFVVHEYRFRKQWIVRPDIMFEVSSAVLIREDEDPHMWDESLHQQKVQQLTSDVNASSGGTYGFFYKPTLKQWLPQLAMSKQEFEDYLKKIEMRLSQWKELTKKGLGLSSKKAGRTQPAGVKS